MEQRPLGGSGISVSKVILGCGNFGGVGSAPHLFGQGTPPGEAHRIMDAAWDLGITTFDTADAYGGGRSEATIGEWLRTKGEEARERCVVQTKTFNPMDVGHDRGLAGTRILRQAETSLGRLGLERIPLYMAHDWDEEVPVEETLAAFDELVRAGKVGAVGCSNMTAEQLAEAVEVSELEGLARYEWVQNKHSLLEQGDAETVVPVCREHGLGYECFSPLAGGFLAGRYTRGDEPLPGSRLANRPDDFARYRTEPVYAAIDALTDQAAARGVTTAALSLAWLLTSPDVTAVIVGPRRVEHLEPVADALGMALTQAERAELAAIFG